MSANDIHPNEVELFEYVEDDGREPAVSAHVSACAECAERVRELELARAALRETPLLHMPPRRLEALFERLGPQERRPSFLAPKRLLGVLVPVAALAAVVAVFATGDFLGDARDEQGAGEALPALEAQRDSAAGAEESAQMQAPAAEPVRRVEGTPAMIAALFREAGYEARDVGGAVEVEGATPAQVRQVLFDVPDGDVPVYVR